MNVTHVYEFVINYTKSINNIPMIFPLSRESLSESYKSSILLLLASEGLFLDKDRDLDRESL